jgi:lipopolysaccharide biosynthesis regulator YciM
MENYVFFSILIGLAAGWSLGYFYAFGRIKNIDSHQPSDSMKHRLQLFFDSYSDESIDRFIQSLDVTEETLSLHISIGKHFRTQGEVEKAILVHQNLMAHPEISSKASEVIIYELAKDYRVAGLFDRAQALLQQLKESRQFGLKSLRLLLEIHEIEKDWQSALSEAQSIDFRKHKDISMRVAQYLCEISEQSFSKGLYREAIQGYRQALNTSKECYRAHFGLAQIAFRNNEYAEALVQLKLLISLSPAHIMLTLPLFLEVTKSTDSYVQHQQYLLKLMNETGQIPVMLAIVESMLEEGNPDKASAFLFDHLNHSPSLSGLHKLFRIDVLSQYSAEDILALVGRVLDEINFEQDGFKCMSCGFSSSQLHWLCPSCRSWQSIKPVIEYESSFQK